ncbi:MAG: tRNA (guanine(46)-N(7))-methyltransferase TrmB [Bauldia sp.]
MPDRSVEAPYRRLHGRRKGRPLSPTRTALVADRSADLLLDLAKPSPADPRDLFPVPVREIRFEVGCGGGEHLIHEALAAPDVGFIGVEPFEEAFGKIVAGVDAAGLRNVRLFADDAALVFDWLPENSLARVDVLYPDPWPKRRHWKRRFVSDENLDRMARLLRPGGAFRCASDIPGYIDWTLQRVAPRTDFRWTAERADDWRKPWAGWPGTRYEGKALRAGRVPAYLVFERA